MADTIQNDDIKHRILEYLKEGVTKKDSAILAGISEATFYRWVEADESFESQVEASILEYKHSLIKSLITSTAKDGRLALEILARRYPQEWGVNSGKFERNEELNKERETIAELFQKILDGEHVENEEPNQISSNTG